jgi:hypothetical protein
MRRNDAAWQAQERKDFDMDVAVEQLLPIGAGMPRLPLWDIDDLEVAA